MAITNNGTKNSLPSNQLPTGYVKPTVAEFSDQEYENDLTLTIVKSVVENASGSVTMANIITNLNTQIDGILAADYIATQTVTAWADLVSITNNLRSLSGDSDWLKNIVPSYSMSLKLYVKTA